MFSLFSFYSTPPFQENLAVLAHMMDALKRDFSDAWTQPETLITAGLKPRWAPSRNISF